MLASMLMMVALAQAAPAPTPRLRVALLPVLVDPGPDFTASNVFRLVFEQTRLRKTLRLMSIDEFFFNDGGTRADRVLACGSDTRCVARQLSPFRADLGLVVIVNGRLDPPLAGVLTLDIPTERPIAEKYEQVPAEELRRVLQTTVADHFDRAGHPRWARLEVNVDPSNAGIAVEPSYTPEAGRPNLFIVPPGQYTVMGQLDGYQPDRQTAALSPGATTEVALRLTKESSWYESPWVWVGAAVVVGAAVTVAAVTLGPEKACGCIVTADQPMCPPCP